MRESVNDLLEYTKGERLRASTVNALIRAIKASHQPGVMGMMDEGATVSSSTLKRHSDLFPFKNEFAGVCPRHGVMRVVSGTTINGVSGFRCNRPDENLQRLYVVNALHDVPQDGYGWCTLLESGGLVRANQTPAVGQTFGVSKDDFTLSQHRPGFEASGANVNQNGLLIWAVQYRLQMVLGKTAAAINDGASGTVKLMTGQAGSEVDTSNLQIENCVNRTGIDIDEDILVSVVWPNGWPLVLPVECS